MWLKVKVENSNWPTGCNTDAEKENYINQFEAVEGIRLNKEAICHNPSLRLIAQLFLNR